MRHNCTDPAEDRQAVGGSKQKSEISFHKSVSLSEPSVWSLTLSLSILYIYGVGLSLEREKGQNGELVVARG
jgi:hypothetical protein